MRVRRNIGRAAPDPGAVRPGRLPHRLVATGYGESLIDPRPDLTLHTGRMDQNQMREFLEANRFDAVVGRHPSLRGQGQRNLPPPAGRRDRAAEAGSLTKWGGQAASPAFLFAPPPSLGGESLLRLGAGVVLVQIVALEVLGALSSSACGSAFSSVRTACTQESRILYISWQ